MSMPEMELFQYLAASNVRGVHLEALRTRQGLWVVSLHKLGTSGRERAVGFSEESVGEALRQAVEHLRVGLRFISADAWRSWRTDPIEHMTTEVDLPKRLWTSGAQA